MVPHDGTSYEAQIVGGKEDNDLAVLKIEASGLTPAKFGNSDELQVGDTVYAVGNPLGELEFSMTTGHVSAKDRVIHRGAARHPHVPDRRRREQRQLRRPGV